jgi:hypothetical protein
MLAMGGAAELWPSGLRTLDAGTSLTVCPACGGPMHLIAALIDPHSRRTYLDGVGLDSRLPPIAPARRLPQPNFDFAA